MKDLDKILASLWLIAAIIFYVLGVFNGLTGEDYIKPFLEAICCTGYAIYYKLNERKR